MDRVEIHSIPSDMTSLLMRSLVIANWDLRPISASAASNPRQVGLLGPLGYEPIMPFAYRSSRVLGESCRSDRLHWDTEH